MFGKVESIKMRNINDKVISKLLSGKSFKDENFPVSSIILEKRICQHIRRFYFFARTADDIADNQLETSLNKKRILEYFSKILSGGGKSNVVVLNEIIKIQKEFGVGIYHAKNLLKAFTMDTNKKRYSDWNDLMNYCKYSANPVGRFVIDLSYKIEKKKPKNLKLIYKGSDGLCSALQILNHMQDCKKDYLEMNRVYIPNEYFKKYKSSVSDLNLNRSTDNFNNLKIELLKKVERILRNSKEGLNSIDIFRLRKETLVIFYIALKLCKLLKNNDPIEKKVKLSRIDLIFCFLKGIIGN